MISSIPSSLPPSMPPPQQFQQQNASDPSFSNQSARPPPSQRPFYSPPALSPSTSKDDELMHFLPLGAGSEVGRSCHILRFKGKTIMLDCGAHPAYNGLGALPFFDEIDPEEIDIILITHFHIDHCASLPYLMEKTTFRGRVFLTHPTKAIFRWMLSDYVRVSATSADDMPYDEHDLQRAYDRIEAIDFHQLIDIEGVRFVAYNAGHVLGAAMFHIEIAGVRVLYTGDYSREEDRHLMAAEIPRDPVDVLVCEATYGVQNHTPRAEREARFTSLVHQVVARGGRCLIPIFALGRAQELLLILDEYWAEHPELQHVPIYYASNLARKCMAVYQTYMNMMNQHIRHQFSQKNPFFFKHISYLRSMAAFDDVGPCVMMASPAMLQSGLSRELLEMWCPDKKNGLIIPGYVVEGTLGKHLLSDPNEIVSYSGSKLPVRCSIDYISFSAHVDYAQNREFINLINPSHLILVHGETNMMTRLRQALVATWNMDGVDKPPKVHAPKNAEQVILHFKGEKYAKALGNLALALEGLSACANKEPGSDKSQDTDMVDAGNDKDQLEMLMKSGGAIIQGLVVSKDFHYHLVAVDELREFTDLRPATIHMRQYVPLESATWDLVVWHLELVFPEDLVVAHVPVDEDGGTERKLVKPESGSSSPTTKVPGKSSMVKRAFVCDVVTISLAENQRELIVEWTGTPVNDVLADAVVAVLLHIESSPLAVKLTSQGQSKVCGHSHKHSEEGCSSPNQDTSSPNNESMPDESGSDPASPGINIVHGIPTLENLAAKVKEDILSFLGMSFEHVDEDAEGRIVVEMDNIQCTIDVHDLTIQCEDKSFLDRIQEIVEQVGLMSSALWLEQWVEKNP